MGDSYYQCLLILEVSDSSGFDWFVLLVSGENFFRVDAVRKVWRSVLGMRWSELELAQFRCIRCGSLHRWRQLLVCLSHGDLLSAEAVNTGKSLRKPQGCLSL